MHIMSVRTSLNAPTRHHYHHLHGWGLFIGFRVVHNLLQKLQNMEKYMLVEMGLQERMNLRVTGNEFSF